MFHLGILYWVSNPYTLCSDKADSPVTDRDECRRAFPYIKTEYPTYSIEDFISLEISKVLPLFYSYPKWCFILVSPEQNQIQIYWNPQPTGRKNDWAQQICTSSGK